MGTQIFTSRQTTLRVLNVSGSGEPETRVYENARIDPTFLGYVKKQMGHAEPNAAVFGEVLRMTEEYDLWERMNLERLKKQC